MGNIKNFLENTPENQECQICNFLTIIHVRHSFIVQCTAFSCVCTTKRDMALQQTTPVTGYWGFDFAAGITSSPKLRRTYLNSPARALEDLVI